MASKYDQLHPLLQRVYTEAKASYIEDHPGDVPLPQLDATYRSNAIQTAYYAQGRQALAEVNRLRKLAGLGSVGEKEAKLRITNAKAGQSAHNFSPSRAFDVVFVQGGKSIWDEKYYIAFAKYIQEASKKLGIPVSSGANWTSFKDYPHHELLSWKTIK